MQTIPVHRLLVCHQIPEQNPAVRANLSVGDHPFLKLFNQEWPRDIEKIGALLRR